MKHSAAARRLADPSPILRQVIAEDPCTVGNLIWPYQCTAWTVDQQLDRIEGHFAAIRKLPALRLALDGSKLVFADLSDFRPGVALMLDRPPWLVREGHLTLSIFLGDFRAYSVSFSMSARDVFIGGIQGRQAANILLLYRELTKDFYGLRPRDLLLEGLRLFAVNAGVHRIFAVTDEFKICAHHYFKGRPAGRNLKEIWEDRGGQPAGAFSYELPCTFRRRPPEVIPAKKRPLYRRRYQMLDELAARSTFTGAPLVSFKAT